MYTECLDCTLCYVFITDANKKTIKISCLQNPGVSTPNYYFLFAIVRMENGKWTNVSEKRFLPNSIEGQKCFDFLKNVQKEFERGNISAKQEIAKDCPWLLQGCINIFHRAVNNTVDKPSTRRDESERRKGPRKMTLSVCNSTSPSVVPHRHAAC